MLYIVKSAWYPVIHLVGTGDWSYLCLQDRPTSPQHWIIPCCQPLETGDVMAQVGYMMTRMTIVVKVSGIKNKNFEAKKQFA